jgi:hypothetical protein
MFETLGRSWEFTKMSFGIIWDFKNLIIFPMVSSAVFLVVCASFAIPFWLTGMVDQLAAGLEQGDAAGEVLYWVLLFAFYFVSYLVMTFFNTGLVACAMQALDGEVPTVGYGMSVAVRRLPQIVAWAFVGAIVGVILKMLERNRKIGSFVASLLGMAWSALTFFVVPILAVEGVGPIEAIKKSGGILRKHWGTALVSNFSLGLIGFLIMLPVLVLGGVLVVLAVGTASIVAIVLAVAFVVLVGFIVSSAITAADVVLKAVLYNFATDKSLPKNIDRRELELAFEPKTS